VLEIRAEIRTLSPFSFDAPVPTLLSFWKRITPCFRCYPFTALPLTGN
jgi:hypothetical protein